MALILIVEDEAISAMFLETAVAALGHQVSAVVNTGEAALESVADRRPDAILMDIHLLGELNGVQAANRILAEYGLESIFMTAYSREEIMADYARPEALHLLPKPVNETDLARALAAVGVG